MTIRYNIHVIDMFSMNVAFHSPHSPGECYRRLQEAVDTAWLPCHSSKPVIGRVRAHFISMRKRIRFRNSFQTVLRAWLRPTPRGTEITGTLGLHPFVRIFLFIWFGGLLGCAIALCAGIVDGAPTLMTIIGLPAVAACGVAVVMVGRYLARDEAAFLRRFIAETLDATDVTAPREQQPR